MVESIVDEVRQAGRKRILFLPHALDAMNAPDELITSDEVRSVLFGGVVIEDYPEDARGHSCLIFGYGQGSRPVHVVCAPKAEYVVSITVYLPDVRRWETDWKTRRDRR